ncbi:hypothetical protein ICN48_13010 [Polynucleobacter sp. JS-Safj-400b-B2]|uniref:hypothetical protein n=1 Tax=Polynucleobacter sp. JS-Safj-400b-B2 TaxID=2576921 RepID=UPI001C0CCF4A|nr:hypothetical protein [Polynucleobacter sp. JS-Safj-400b-B2]MBU3627149.1 hypothetical protein [Polynucleobacter sp. JS-Safj-400b-B2]
MINTPAFNFKEGKGAKETKESCPGLIYYNSYDLFKLSTKKVTTPGSWAFATYYDLFSSNITVLDRTGTFSVPVAVAPLDFLALPELDSSHEFEAICDARARALLDQALSQNRRIAVMYSGGIDSTLVLCAFLKVARSNELQRITVLLSEASILENPDFYHDHVLTHFECVSSFRFPYYLGNPHYLFVSGENADQLFGSQVAQVFEVAYGFEALFKPLVSMYETLLAFFIARVGGSSSQYAQAFLEMLLRLCANAPIAIETPYHFFWWINFATKWQSVYVRMLPYSAHRNTLALEENYTTFYSPPPFQQWSMANTDQFIGHGFETGKWVSKQYIYDFNHDARYLKKLKQGSLQAMVRCKANVFGIELANKANLRFITQPLGAQYFNIDNDFMRMEHASKSPI